MHPQLDELDHQLETIAAQVQTTFGSLDQSAFQHRPGPNGWSPGECIAHLTLTTEAFLPLLDQAMERVPASPANVGRYKRGMLPWLLERYLEPPVRRGFPTTPPFVPRSDGSPAEVVSGFLQSQENLRRRLRQADGRPLGKTRIVSPFNARMSYNVYAAFRILTAHQRRHVWQAEQAMAMFSPQRSHP